MTGRRTFFPDTLFGRNTLLILTLIVFGQLTGALLFLQFVQKPRIEQLAAVAARQIRSTQALLEAIPSEQQPALIMRINSMQMADSPQIHIAAQIQTTDIGLTPRDLLMTQFAKRVARRLQLSERDIRWSGTADGTLWAPLQLNGKQYWIGIRGMRTDGDPWRLWLGVSLFTTALAVGGSYFIQRRINRPLQTLVAATSRLAEGEQPELLSEDGPTEIASVSRSFNRMTESLAQIDHERAIMLAGVSHDLRTPLAKLRLGLEILRGHHLEADILANMTRSTEEMDAIIDQFLNYARVGSSEALTEVDLNELVRECAAVYLARGHTLLTHLGDIPPMLLRRQAMERLLTNLVENAMRYGKPEFQLCTQRTNDSVQLCVIDHGPGIPDPELNAMKKPFVRGSTARGGPPGAGLGLAIVERIAHLHDGHMELSATEGGGLTAKVELPVQPISAS